MFSSVALMWLFTVVFVGTGVYSVVRLAALVSGVHSSVDRAAELSHLVMSLAMVAMTWGWSGGPSSASGALQVVVFSLAGLYFLAGAVRGYRAPVAAAYHLVMALAMVWMVATMPLLMGAMSSPGMAMDGMPGMSSGAPHPASAGAVAGADGWVAPVSLTFVALLVAAALFWGVRGARCSTAWDAEPHRAVSMNGTCCAPEAGSTSDPVPVGSSVSGADGGVGAVALAVAIAPPKHIGSLLSPRADAVCHAVMSAGMAGMLAGML